MHGRVAVAGALLILCGGMAHAQDVVPGSAVRIWAAAPPLTREVARVREVRGDTLFLERGALPDGNAALLVPLANVERLEIATPRSRGRGALRGAGLGALTGLGVGLVFSVVIYEINVKQNCPGDECMAGLAFVIVPPVGTALGLVVGTISGAASPGTVWRCVSGDRCLPTSQTASMSPGARGALVAGLSLRY